VKRLAVLLAAVAAIAISAGAPAAVAASHSTAATHPAKCSDAWNLHAGSCGERVDGWQWMISGHCPNRFAVACGGKVKPTLHRYTPGSYGARTKAATVALRYRLGFPAKGQCGAKASKLVPEVGPWFWALLRGTRDNNGKLIATRPACWVALAQSRIELVDDTQPTKLALAIRAWELQQVGTREGGWNVGSVPGPGGWSINRIQSVFGTSGLAYCEIFQEVAFSVNGYQPIPFFPASPFAVIPSYRTAAALGWVVAKPQIGSLMVWLGDDGHIGFVADVDADSAGHVRSYTTVEGNTHPEGGGAEGIWVKHYPVPGSSLRLFINLPRLTK
jgi:hypothetical protein